MDGTGLYYYGARFYYPTLGRLINMDPAKDGGNWQVYVNNNPLRYVDPTGMYLKEALNNIGQFVENYNAFWTDDSLYGRPLWKEATDILEGEIGTKFGLEVKFDFFGFKGKAGGGIGTIPFRLEGSELSSWNVRDIGFTFGLPNSPELGLRYKREIPWTDGKLDYSMANYSPVVGLQTGTMEAEPSTISIGGTFFILTANFGINLTEIVDFFHKGMGQWKYLGF